VQQRDLTELVSSGRAALRSARLSWKESITFGA
jgi:hypothetical protein